MNFNEQNRQFEDQEFRRYSRKIEEAEDEEDRKSEHRDPRYFDYWPNDEQLEMFKRGGR